MKPLEQEIPLPIKPPVLASASRDFNSDCQDGYDLEHASKNTNGINKKVHEETHAFLSRKTHLMTFQCWINVAFISQHIENSQAWWKRKQFLSMMPIHAQWWQTVELQMAAAMKLRRCQMNHLHYPRGFLLYQRACLQLRPMRSPYFLIIFLRDLLVTLVDKLDLKSCTFTFSDAGGANTEDIWRQIRCVESMVICWASEWDLDIC